MLSPSHDVHLQKVGTGQNIARMVSRSVSCLCTVGCLSDGYLICFMVHNVSYLIIWKELFIHCFPTFLSRNLCNNSFIAIMAVFNRSMCLEFNVLVLVLSISIKVI